jgi:hypothetical protein
MKKTILAAILLGGMLAGCTTKNNHELHELHSNFAEDCDEVA